MAAIMLTTIDNPFNPFTQWDERSKKQTIEITDKEWEAIQAGAISQNTLTQILNNADLDAVKQLATPRSSTGLSAAKIAEQLGVSVTTINNAVKGD